MGVSRKLIGVLGAAGAALAGLGAFADAAAPHSAAAPPLAAVHMIPFAAGHVLAAGQAAQPPTTAQCQQAYGVPCYQASQIQQAYNLSPLFARGVQGQGETIVVVDALGAPSIASDLRTFDSQLGLPDPPSFRVITPAGPVTTTAGNCVTTYVAGGPDTCADYYSWTDETSLDVEWAHAMAPKASILLVETPMTETGGVYGFPQIVAAENYVINHHLGDVISQSFGAAEQTFDSPSQIDSLRSAYINAARGGVTVLAGSGDTGATSEYCGPGAGCAAPGNVICCDSTRSIIWPAADPLVTAVGGTQLSLDSAGGRTAPDSVWSNLSSSVGVPGPVYNLGASGGGSSTVFARPRFQDSVAGIVGDARGTPDIAMSAAFVDYYNTSDPSVAGWGFGGGTSISTPLFAGIVALADQVAGHSLGDLNPALYTLAKNGARDGIAPISTGGNTYTFCAPAYLQADASCASSSDLVTVPGFSANGRYGEATGWGTVNAALFVPALARFATDDGQGDATGKLPADFDRAHYAGNSRDDAAGIGQRCSC
jgi:subtilase family serine protease